MEANIQIKIEEVDLVVINGKPVEAKRFITSRKNKQYQFNRVAKHLFGDFCFDKRRDDEVVLSPGLIYRLVSEV